MSQAHDSRSTRSSLHPKSFSPARLFRKRSSNSSIGCHGHSLQSMKFSRGHKTSDRRTSQSQDNIQEPPIPGENPPHPKFVIPPLNLESLGYSSHLTLQSSILAPTREASMSNLLPTTDDRSRDEVPYLSDLSAPGTSGNHTSFFVHNGRDVAISDERDAAVHIHEIVGPEEYCTVYPTWPRKIPRWDNQSKFIDPKASQYDIKAGTLDYSRPETVGNSEWKWLTHPDGLPYFYHEKKRVITEAYIPQNDVREHIDKFIKEMDEYIQRNASKLDPTIYAANQRVLVYEKYEGRSPVAGYYFVNHEHQSIFWLEDLPGDELVKDLQVDGKLSKAQFGFRINSEYWLHRSLYPGLQPVTAREIGQVRDVVHSAMSDINFSDFSTSPFMYETLGKIEEIVEKRIKIHPGSPLPRPESYLDPILEKSIGQTLEAFSNKRFLDCYGEKLSRISAEQHLHPGSHAHKTSSTIMLILTYFLFSSPRSHLQKLREVYVDFVVVRYSWKDYLEKLNQDWEAILILAGVILAVVVSFLAMPSVDTGSSPALSPIQLLGYASVTANIGSIVIVLMLKSLFYKSKSQGQAITEKADKTLRAAYGSRFGLEGLAIVFSLPRVLMIWAILLFAGAFFTLCFRETTLVTRILSGIPAAIISGICIWSFCVLRMSNITEITLKVTETAASLVHQCRIKFWGATGDDNQTLTNDGPAPQPTQL